MSQQHPDTHAELIERLRDSIGRLRQNIEARSDPTLEEIAHALGLLLDLTAHTHDHTSDHRRRLETLERAARTGDGER